jgi:hypothetical protein
LNKRQEALRRGLRSFIADALHELEALQPRPSGHDEPQGGAEPAEPATDLIITDRAADPARSSRTSRPAGPSEAKRPRPAAPAAAVEPKSAPPAQAQAQAQAVPAQPAEPDPDAGREPREGARAAASSAPLAPPRIIVPGWTDTREEVRPLVVPDGCRGDDQEERPPTAGTEPQPPPAEEPLIPPPAATAESPSAGIRSAASDAEMFPATAPPAAPAVPKEKRRDGPASDQERARPRTRRADRGAARKRAAPRHRIPSGLAGNGATVEQAYGRKGVCFAYFINAECWRVPEAYCNSALQVCITRDCPVYQLHKEPLEQRFARKFRHFW